MSLGLPRLVLTLTVQHNLNSFGKSCQKEFPTFVSLNFEFEHVFVFHCSVSDPDPYSDRKRPELAAQMEGLTSGLTYYCLIRSC